MDFCLVANKPRVDTCKEFYVHSIDEADLLFDVVLNVTGIEVPPWPDLSEYECGLLAIFNGVRQGRIPRGPGTMGESYR